MAKRKNKSETPDEEPNGNEDKKQIAVVVPENFKYRNRVLSNKGKIHNKWLECNKQTKEMLEKNYPNHFIFEPILAPEPTPSMKKL